MERKRNNRNDGVLEYWNNEGSEGNTGIMEDWVEEEKDGIMECWNIGTERRVNGKINYLV